MPGTREPPISRRWFKQAFGFEEETFESTRKRFAFENDILTCSANGQSFHAGPFELLNGEELSARLAQKPVDPALGGLTFDHVITSTQELHLDTENAGAVFQVASLFNCLAMSSPNIRREDGIANYADIADQGSACSIACPAATVFRNYFASGSKELDCLADVGNYMNNKTEGYWYMKSGYCMPKPPGRIGKLSWRLDRDPNLAEIVRSLVRVGVHWDTEVAGGGQRVCQVLCSTAPVAFTKMVKAADWGPFAITLLDAAYQGTLAVADLLARKRGCRVRVFLTAVGGGALGNRTRWIIQAIQRAVRLHEHSPLDVALVHLDKTGPFRELEPPVVPPPAPRLRPQRKLTEDVDALHRTTFGGNSYPADTSPTIDVALVFSYLDLNGNGVIERCEMFTVLQSLDAAFFTKEVVDKMFDAADCDGDGDVHYVEFLSWLCDEDYSTLAIRVLSCAPLAKAQRYEPNALRSAGAQD